MAAGTAVRAWMLVLSLWGAVTGDQNITARIGKPLVLNCKGAPKKPPQQLEWKLNTGRTEAWKVLSPQGDPWDSVARVLPNGSLLLPAVGIQDEGTFRCRATSRSGKETKSNYRVRVYQIPGKPEIVDPASELMAGVPSKVGTCVSEGGYPAGTLSWHLDGKTLTPDGKGVSVKEETKRHPETGLFTLHSELMVTPTRGGALHPTFSCSFTPGLPRRRALHTAPIQLRVWSERRGGEGPSVATVPLEEVQLVVEPEGGAVALGGTVTLTCEAPAQPPPQIHWIKDVSDPKRGLAGQAPAPSPWPRAAPPRGRARGPGNLQLCGHPSQPWAPGEWCSQHQPHRNRRGGDDCRLCGRAGAGNPSPVPGDPGRPGDSRPPHWGHHVASKAATQRTGEEGPGKPGGGRGGASGTEPARGARGSREQHRRALRSPRPQPIHQPPFLFPHSVLALDQFSPV